MSKKIIQDWYVKLLKFILVGTSCACVMIGAYATPNEGIQEYQKNLHLSPIHKQNLADAITRYRNADNLWDVLSEAFTLPHYEDNPEVQEKIEWYMNNQDFLLRSASRAAPYLYYILQQVKKRHLPAELVLLPIVESGYNPFAVSPVGATGIWQMMPSTATGLGVKQDWWYDARRDVIASTRGALNYLAYLQSFFDGNWLLAIAAYNTGEGNVLAAIKRNIREGRDTDFWSLPVAQQTRDYVPSILALAIIITHPDQYPIYLPPVRNAPYLASVDVGSTQLSLKIAASLAGISYTKMVQLNPGFMRASTGARSRSKIVLPIENVEQFSENLAMSAWRQPRQPGWSHYKVRAGDTLFSIARKFNTSSNAIRELNHLASNSIHRGVNLLIPTTHGKIAPVGNSPNELLATRKERAMFAETKTRLLRSNNPLTKLGGRYKLQPGDTIYMVRSRDSLASISKHFHISAQSLLAANHPHMNRIKPGMQIIVPTHLRNTKNTNKARASLKPGDTIYMVRKGDTIEKIAKKFHTLPSAIRVANLIDNTRLNEGERLVIPTHIRG